jgi:hypothetical protein
MSTSYFLAKAQMPDFQPKFGAVVRIFILVLLLFKAKFCAFVRIFI